jgi:hypothetical protein
MQLWLCNDHLAITTRGRGGRQQHGEKSISNIVQMCLMVRTDAIAAIVAAAQALTDTS